MSPPIRPSLRVPSLLAAWSVIVASATTTTTASSTCASAAIRPTSHHHSSSSLVAIKRHRGGGGRSSSSSSISSSSTDGIDDDGRGLGGGGGGGGRRTRLRRRRRTLSAEEQLDILRLGFVPVERHMPSSPPASTTTTTTTTTEAAGGGVVGRHRGRWGAVVGRRRLVAPSTADYLDILRLGFISPSKSAYSNGGRSGDGSDDDEDASVDRAMTRVGRGGGGGGAFVVVVDDDDDDDDHHHHHHHDAHRVRRGGGDGSRHRIDAYIAVVLAFLAGISNAICQGRFDCFATMMTGNTIAMSTAMSAGRWYDALFRSKLIGGYVIGTACARYVEKTTSTHRGMAGTGRRLVDEDAHRRRPWIVLSPIVAVIFAIADAGGRSRLLHDWKGDVDGGRIALGWDVPLLAVGYGMIYSYANRALGSTMTHVVTGHITKLGEALSDMSCHGGVGKSVRVLASFVSGVIVGAQLSRVANDGKYPIFTLLGVAYALVLAWI
ncbi:hypothetical protein ACHAXA_009937 [Cyclostephanos tholiformis]|uniref:DUF1275 domain-containing protein n=1 Tax=Cyclostephanos tholiformis TaxID=382380 RepID=A0ABD3RY46_9STRA